MIARISACLLTVCTLALLVWFLAVERNTAGLAIPVGLLAAHAVVSMVAFRDSLQDHRASNGRRLLVVAAAGLALLLATCGYLAFYFANWLVATPNLAAIFSTT